MYAQTNTQPYRKIRINKPFLNQGLFPGGVPTNLSVTKIKSSTVLQVMPHLTSCHDWILTPTQIRKLKTSQTKSVLNPSTHSNLRYHQNSIIFSFKIRPINKHERRFARNLHQLLYLHSKFPHPSLRCSSYALYRSGDAIHVFFHKLPSFAEDTTAIELQNFKPSI